MSLNTSEIVISLLFRKNLLISLNATVITISFHIRKNFLYGVFCCCLASLFPLHEFYILRLSGLVPDQGFCSGMLATHLTLSRPRGESQLTPHHVVGDICC